MYDLRYWPREWTVDGKKVHLRFREMGPHGETTEGLQDISRLHAGFSHAGYYVPLDDDHFKSRRGPFFVWWPEGSLAGRAYETASRSEHWTNDREGKLLFYHRTSSVPRPRSWLSCSREPKYFERHVLTEWYSTQGELVSLETGEAFYWKGVRVSGMAAADSHRTWMRERYPETGPRPID